MPDPTKPEGEQAQTGAAGQQGAAPQKADPELLKLQDQVEKLTKQGEADRQARLAAEKKTLVDRTHATLREALEAKGIRGPLARAAIHDLESTGALRYTEEGVPELVVKRSRVKGAAPEDLAFEDLSEGVKDWFQTDDGKAFAPAPVGTVPGSPRLSGTRSAQLPPIPEATNLSEAARNAAEALRRNGMLPPEQ